MGKSNVLERGNKGFFWTLLAPLLYSLGIFPDHEGVFVRLTTKLMAMGLLLSTAPVLALPIDWGGSIAFDTTMLSKFCRTNDAIVDKTPSGTEGIANGDCGAHFQTYIFKLNPHMIVNDAVSIKGELSTGHTRGGFLGGDSTQSQNPNAGGNAYYSTVPAQRDTLNINQLYAEIYADTAMMKVGRFAKGFGTGAILSEGKGTYDRFFTQYDGIQGEMRIGNFGLTPHFAKLNTYDNTNQRAEANGTRDVREMGLIATYDNKNTNLLVALAFTKRFSERQNSLLNSGDNVQRGRTNVTLLDAYLEKKWEKFSVKVEVPMMAGEYGNVYADGSQSRISNSAVLVETLYSPSAKWDHGIHAGRVGGDKGSTGRFEGMYLNPNYHIAELMFRYNYSAFNTGTNSIFDAYITNAQFLKWHSHYKTDKWTWNASVIMATAMQTAKSGSKAYHHEQNYQFNAVENQSNKYGTEIDLSFDYLWNPNVKVSSFLAYWMVGNYYAFDNSANSKIAVQNVLGSGLRLGIDF